MSSHHLTEVSVAGSSRRMWTSFGSSASPRRPGRWYRVGHGGRRRDAAALGGRSRRTPLPARVPGSDLIWSLSAAARPAPGGASTCSGGDPGYRRRPRRAAPRSNPGLAVAGTDSPPYGFDRTPDGIAGCIANVVAAKPDIVFVGIGFPRQERLIVALAEALPGTWFLGCGASIPFVAGTLQRAPVWMQRPAWSGCTGWPASHAGCSPGTYCHDAPYAARLMAAAARTRLRRRPEPAGRT